MGIRQAIQKPAVGASVGIALLVLALVIAFNSNKKGDDGLVSNQWYFDLETGELFTAAPAQTPPIDAPSGAGNGVEVFVYACDSCDDASKHFIGYLRKVDKAALEIANENRDKAAIGAATQLRTKDGEWVASNSDEAKQIKADIQTKCPAGKLRQCQAK